MATVLNVELTLEQLLTAIRKLDGPARTRVAEVLAETHLGENREGTGNLDRMIRELANTAPADDISNVEITDEIMAYRRGQAGTT